MRKYITKHFEYEYKQDENEKRIHENGVKNIFKVDTLDKKGTSLNMEIDEFCRYCKCHNVEEVFRSSYQEPIEKYMITEDILKDNSEGGEETYIFLKKFADEWNEELMIAKKAGIDKTGIDVFTAIVDGLLVCTYVGHDFIKDFVNDLDCIDKRTIKYHEISGYQILYAFIQRYFDEYVDTIREDDAEDNLIDEFYEMILNDENFFMCTNKSMRESYACDLWKKNSIRIKYEKLFGSPFRMALEMDKIYGNYRRGLYNDKNK